MHGQHTAVNTNQRTQTEAYKLSCEKNYMAAKHYNPRAKDNRPLKQQF